MACRQAKTWSRCISSHGLGLRLMTSRLACSSCAIERGVQMARVVREDWPHVDMDMGKRQVGEGKWAGEEGARAHTLQGLIRRASRLSPVPRLRTPPRVSAGCITFTMSRKLLFRLLRGALCGLRWIASHSAGALAPSGEPCAAVQARCPSLARGPGERQRVAVGSSSSLILMTAESRQCYNSRTPAHDRHVGALSIEP